MTRFYRAVLVLSLAFLLPALTAAGAGKNPKPPRYNPKVPHLGQQRPGAGKGAAGKNSEVVLQADDAVQVRLNDPPQQYDDKGNIKSYTKTELQELKGSDKTLPGYPGDYDNLAKGQTVLIYLSRKLPAKTDTAKDKAAAKADDKAADNKPADNPKDADKAGAKIEQTRWASLGKLNGQVQDVSGSSKKASKNADAGKTFTLRVDPATLAALQRYKGPKTADDKGKDNRLADDIYVTMIVVTGADKSQK